MSRRDHSSLRSEPCRRQKSQVDRGSSHPFRDLGYVRVQSRDDGLGRRAQSRRVARGWGSVDQRGQLRAGECSGRCVMLKVLLLGSGRLECETREVAIVGVDPTQRGVAMVGEHTKNVVHHFEGGHRTEKALAAVEALGGGHTRGSEARAPDCIDPIFATCGKGGWRALLRRIRGDKQCGRWMARQVDVRVVASSVDHPCAGRHSEGGKLHHASKSWRKCVLETRHDPVPGNSQRRDIRLEKEGSLL